MLMDALDSWLEAKDKESKLKAQGAGSPNDMMNVDPELQKVRATVGDGGVTDFMSHLGTTLGARVLGKTGLDELGVGQGSQAMQNAIAYQHMKPQMLNSGTVNPPGLQGPLNAQIKNDGGGKSLMKMLAKMMMGA